MTMIISGSTGLEFPDGSDQTTAAVATTPGGSNTYVQYNNAGAFGGDSGFVYSSGNVGIGTSSPSSKLHVAGTGTQGITVERTDASTAGLFQLLSGNSTNVINASTAKPISFEINAAERMRITSAGDVGIGTSSPARNLSVVASSAPHIQLALSGDQAASNGFELAYDGSANYIAGRENVPTLFSTNNTERARISAAGGFSVGTTADPGAGAIYATGNITAYYSDDRLKTKLGGIENALDKVKSLSGFYYEANQTAQDLGYQAVREVGVSAQQVQAVMPEVVKPAPIDQQYLTVDYERLVPLLIEAIKELEEKVAKLEAK